MNDLSKSLKILVDRYPGTMAELARQAQIDRSSLYKIMDGKRMPNRAQLQRLIHALGLSARQAEHLTTQYDAAAPRPTVPMKPCTSCCRRRCAPATT